jgi:hypothetical protein
MHVAVQNSVANYRINLSAKIYSAIGHLCFFTIVWLPVLSEFINVQILQKDQQ